MKKFIFILGVLLGFFLLAPEAFACEPCPDTLNFEETVNNSDLIIIGQQINYAVDESPESIEVKIITVLKGEAEQNQITVNSWDGMCPYGIVVDDKTYVMLLEKRENEDYQYDTVNFGCSVTTFLVEGEMVDFEGEKISVENFAAKFGSQLLPPPQQDNFIYYALFVVIVVALALFLILKFRKK